MVKKIKLDKEEQQIEDQFTLWESASPAEFKMAQKTIKNFKNKTERVNVRMNHLDILKLREKALREGIPYQTLLAGIVHKYVNGDLLDKSETNKLLKLISR